MVTRNLLIIRRRNMQKPSEDRKLLTLRDLAAELDVPISTIYNWRIRGRGPRGIMVGRSLRFRRRDVEEWLDSQADPERSGG